MKNLLQNKYLIRQWNKNWGSDIDFVKIKSYVDSDLFEHSEFYRISEDGSVSDIQDKKNHNERQLPYYDTITEFIDDSDDSEEDRWQFKILF